MPYYRAGDYYRGDYYRGNYGDGFFKKLIGGVGKVIGKVAGTALKLTPVGRVAAEAISLVPKLLPRRTAGPPPGLLPGFEFGPGGFESFGGGPFGPGTTGLGVGLRKRRRLDPLNVRALRRAGRRLKGFLRIARRLGALPVAGGKGKRVFKVARRRK